MEDERYSYTAFGNRVRELRKAHGWSQEGLAQRSGLDRTYIGRCEAGKQNATLKTIYALARALEVEPAALVADWPNGGAHT